MGGNKAIYTLACPIPSWPPAAYRAHDLRLPHMVLGMEIQPFTETPCGACNRPSLAFTVEGGGVHHRHRSGDKVKWHWSGESSPLYVVGHGPHAGTQLHLVEGETDTHALHAVGLPAAGVLGAHSAGAAIAQLVQSGIAADYSEIVAWIEPGAGGEKMAAQARAAASDMSLTLRIAHWPLNEPDARALLAATAAAHRVTLSPDSYDGALSHLRLCAAITSGAEQVASTGKAFRERVCDIARDAVYAGSHSTAIVELSTNAVVGELEVPRGWRVSQRLGIEVDGGDRGFVRVLPVPLLIEAIEVDAHDGHERLLLNWQARGREYVLSMPREQAANSRRLVDAARDGLPVTSENARGVVRWLHELEHAQNGKLARSTVARRSGWVNGRHIHLASDMQLDEGTGSARLLSGLEARGDEAEQEEFLRRVLEHHPMAACMIAASLAACLLDPLHLRGFALHLWGESRGGKTAALKLALSVWGDPLRLMGSWSATANAIEAHAATLCDLPCALDELQAAKSIDHIAQTIYALANGVGRARATVTGDLGVQRSWRTIVLTTGEMPLLPEDAHDGARTRTIDIHAEPFTGARASGDASAAHDLCERSYGRIGSALVSSPLLSPANRSMLRDRHEEACAALLGRVAGEVPAIKLRSAGAMVMALAWLREHVGAHDGPSAVEVVAGMLSVATGQADDDDAHGSMAWKVCQQVLYIVAARRADFIAGARERLGALDVPEPGTMGGESVAWLTVPTMKMACEQAGVPYRRALTILHEAGVTPERLAIVDSAAMGTPTRLFRVSLDQARGVSR